MSYKSKNYQLKTKNVLFFFFILSANIFSQGISGPLFALPGVQTGQYTISNSPSLPCDYPVWHVTTGNFALANTNPGYAATNIIVNVNETGCKVKLTVTYAYDSNDAVCGNSGSGSIEVTVLPKIIIPNPLVAGYNTVYISDNCSHTGCNYLWNVSPATACPLCGPNGTSSQQIFIDPANIPQSITVNCTINGNCSPAISPTSFALTPVSALPKLSNPSISGPNCVGCVGCPPTSNSISLSCNAVAGAAYYQWINQTPSVLQIVSGQGTQSITVNVIGSGSGNITVQALSAVPPATSNAFSSVVGHPINVCCTPILTINNIVNSPNPDDQQAAVEIDATSIISSGATAIYHAGNQVKLLAGFSANPGSYFHGYTSQCTGTYNRLINPQSLDTITSNSGNSSVELNYTNYVTDDLSSNNKPVSSDVTIMPNPTSNTFKLLIDRNLGTPQQIVVRDVMSKDIIVNTHPSYETQFNLENQNAGVYMISIYYADKVISKKVIKQ